ncbi:uncharacterized protein P174DRAFT_276051 [Aspergillus novofumigatus IBT 16806]|uniref:Uncharacterized protein n=1 Tax=Aspergillus novofumigatus (strain IBT 16806) TaxID=1392255 RepID=A0A2I1BZS1_ASPN1|nr:uncharacterized protein P174DRAFT_276051 [Aspergillus novofumigatus IBT 16806]PKX90868.1 hypothetical protein P174DRAFT_276051 [Aspergillus novofumigatus IBT 16806]
MHAIELSPLTSRLPLWIDIFAMLCGCYLLPCSTVWLSLVFSFYYFAPRLPPSYCDYFPSTTPLNHHFLPR